MLKEIRNLLPQLLTIHWNLFGVISWSQREITDSSLDCYAQNKTISACDCLCQLIHLAHPMA